MATNVALTAGATVNTKGIGTSVSELARANFGAQAQAAPPGAATANVASGTGSQASTAAHTASSPGLAHVAASKGAVTTGSAVAKGGAVAVKVSAVAKAMAVVGVGVAGLAVAAHTGAAPGISVALAHVPVWTHAHSVLGSLQNMVHGRASGSASSGISL